MRRDVGRILIHICGDQVVGHNAGKKIKPEERKLGKNLALARNAAAQYMVEGGDAIGGDHEQKFAGRVKITHLATGVQMQVCQFGLE